MTARALVGECCREDTAAWEPCPPFLDLQSENEELKQRVRKLEEALRSFADIADIFEAKLLCKYDTDQCIVSLGQLRRAREALTA